MAAASPADQGAVINGSPPCKLVPCGDGRHFTFRVDYEAVKQSAAAQKLRASCPIGDVYECEATLKLHEHKRNHIGFIVKVGSYATANKIRVFAGG
ncbi:hypothetical protein E2562_027588 [Oryza meyeriana var. granulata]|uniref:Uncharacterized protein n=1 Tax=Oryza meyeriana var. granulata TaxID=110450 RepID=A0A6G1DNU1_9ORYZ|nr:hypothetical protein E2562_027588 [Oryza meyeriana var. granulata]